MNNQDFDQQLRNIYDNSHLPFDAQQWDKIRERLDSDNKSKNLTLLWQKKILLSYKPIIAIASAVIGFIFYVQIVKENRKDDTNAREHHQANAAPAAALTIDSSLQKNVRLGKTNPISVLAKTIEFRKSKESSIAIVNDDTLSKNTIDFTPVTAQQVFNSPTGQKNIESNKRDALVSIEDIRFGNELMDNNTAKRSIYFDILGGYNVNNIKNSFSLGINMKRELHKKLRFDASLSLIGGYNKTFEKFDGEVTAAGVDTVVYKSAVNNVFYLQASPSLSYRLYDGLYTGLGIDAQRLVNTNAKSIVSDSIGKVIGSQPIWDFGITFKMDYQISNKINAGIIYRESLGGVNNIKSPSISRNYILMQMSYTIF